MGEFRLNSEQIPFVQRSFPIGAIFLWHGSIESIPGTFRLCDGTLKTPDLRDRFIPGAGDLYSPFNIGGTSVHEHDFIGNGHTHNAQGGVNLQGGVQINITSNSESIRGTTDPKSHLPIYGAYAYIMYAGRIH